MIRRLRRRHRWMLAVVALVVVPLFLAALGARPERVFEEPSTPPIPPMPLEGGLEVELPTEPPIRVRAERGSGGVVLEASEGPLEDAGLLLYWLPDDTDFPEGAVLLGPVRGHGRQVLALSDGDLEIGVLVLYSLGHGEEVARAEWPGEDSP